jgi:hypothetical protein
MESLSEKMIKRIEDLGRAESLLKNVLEHSIFESLSKHNPYFHSEHELESDRLYDIRCTLGCIHDNLWGVWAILKGQDESEWE